MGVSFADRASTQQFDVYRLRSFATAAGRIVNRGDYFRVRQRVHPAGEDAPLEQLRGPLRSVQPVARPSSLCPPPENVEYRPVVYYATNDDDEETAADDDVDVEEDQSVDERTRLLGDRGRPASYFTRMRLCSQAGGRNVVVVVVV